MYDKIYEYFDENPDVFTWLLSLTPDLLDEDDIQHPMQEFDEYFSQYTPYEIAYFVADGDFNADDDVFVFNGYELYSYEEMDYSHFLGNSSIKAIAKTIDHYCPPDSEVKLLYIEEGLLEPKHCC